MKIRAKIILVVLPVVIAALSIAQQASYLSAYRTAMRITQKFFNFKSAELEKYAETQWSLLLENGFAGRPDMVEAAKHAVMLYAASIISGDTEAVLALDNEGAVAAGTSQINISATESETLMEILAAGSRGISSADMGGTERVFSAFYFTPFGWHILLTEDEHVFYGDLDRIRYNTFVILGVTSALAVLTLIFFAKHLSNPLERVARVMNEISTGGELSSRVEVEYKDETGKLASSFNRMLSELEKAYTHIKRYAFQAALAGKKEQRIRQIFQKYVPKDLIDKFFASPESMLTGENRELAILFSDIRSFTTISENLAPDELVHSLNRYFSGQVDIIMNRNGIVDKYIGDAVMAFWGAPVKHGDDALQAVLSGLEMLGALESFNEYQRKTGKPEFHIGIGINYGTVTVGNIGSERKMDYTVIGDMVNLASRMEGLTKTYHADMLISGALYDALRGMRGGAAAGGTGGGVTGEAPGANARGQSGSPAAQDVPPLSYRLLDTVAVKGKTKGVKIYTVKKALAPREAKAWAFHNKGMELYYRRDFTGAADYFRQALALLPDDFNAGNLLERCARYAVSPPPEVWDGVEVMHSK